jgi:hypothetical protein
VNIAPVPWLVHFAAQRGLKYEPDVDERWIRVWEPYATLRVPIRYEHGLSATGAIGSLTIARFVVTFDAPNPAGPGMVEREASSWLVIAQDTRLEGRVAVTSDRNTLFGEPQDLISVPRRTSGDAAFDAIFSSFSPSAEEMGRALTPSLRKLLLGWRLPVHVEIRPGGFILAPVSINADPAGLTWLLEAIHLFGEKAAKRAQADGPRSR